jgi:ribokinase
MSAAIFDDDGDYGAVIVSGSNLHIAPEQVAVDQLAGASVLVLQNEASETINAAAAANVWKLVDRDGGCSRAKFDDTDLLERS